MRRIAALSATMILSASLALAQVYSEAAVEEARQDYLAGDYATAFAVLVPAAEQGDMVAQNIVGVGYQYGQGLPVDAKSAVYYFLQSGQQGFGAAYHNLGYLYEVGMPGLSPDPARARGYYEQAIALDYNVSRANLGTLLREGTGGPVDLARAVRLYREGADGGDPSAMDALGWVYLNGLGVPADDTAARRYYQMASDAGLAQGTGNLGYMTEMGRGGPLNLKQARQLYQQAIDGGHVHSAINMAWMIVENPQVFRNPAEGIAYCIWAVDHAESDRLAEYRAACDEMAADYSPSVRAEAERIAGGM